MRGVVRCCLVLLAGCSPSLELPDIGATPPPPPDVDGDPTPERPLETPHPTIAFRGQAQGREVFVTVADPYLVDPTGKRRAVQEAAVAPRVVALDDAGRYCVDVRLPATGIYDFELRAYTDDGRAGEARRVRVTRNPGAISPGGVSCSGRPVAECADREVCGNGEDDDCNGIVDDGACRPCPDDFFEDNDTFWGARSLNPGQYQVTTSTQPGLNPRPPRICPNDADLYSVFLAEGDRIDAKVFFPGPTGELHLDLWSVDFEADGNDDVTDHVLLRRSATVDNATDPDDPSRHNESVIFEALLQGRHVISVYAAEPDSNVPYELTIDVQRRP